MKRNYLAVVVVVFLALLAAVYAAKRSSATKNGPPQAAAEHQGHEVAKPQENGMPQQEQQEEAPAVEIPEDKQQMLGMKTVEAAVRPLQEVVRTVGSIEYDERRISTVNTKFEGWIEKLHVDYTGKYVKKGEPLAEMYSPELVATQQELVNAMKWARQNGGSGAGESTKGMMTRDAQVLADAARQRLAFWDITEEQIERIVETGRPVRTLTIYSPVAGYVVQKMALRGMKVMPGDKLFDIADLSSVWIVADIYENEIPLVRQGQKAKISLSYSPGKEMTAMIDYVYPALSAGTRTAKVRFTVPNPGVQLKPQMFTNVEITIPVGNRLVVPADAVLDTGMRQIVYVDKGDGYFEPREIKTGLKVDRFQEVLAGLRAGEKVAASAIFLIDSEAQIKGVRPLAGGHKH